MASLLECPDCNHKVAQSATRCPSCGKTFGAYAKGGMYAVAQHKAQMRGEKFQHAGCFGSFLLICAGIASGLFFLVQKALAFL